MLGWRWPFSRKAKQSERTIVEDKIHARLADIVQEACRYFGEQTECSKDYAYVFDYENKAIQFGFVLENHLYSMVGDRIRLGNTSICGGSIKTVDTSKDRLGLPRAIYKIRLPIYGGVLVEYYSQKWNTSTRKITIIRPVVRVVFSAFDKEFCQKVPSLFSLTVNSVIEAERIGYDLRKENFNV